MTNALRIGLAAALLASVATGGPAVAQTAKTPAPRPVPAKAAPARSPANATPAKAAPAKADDAGDADDDGDDGDDDDTSNAASPAGVSSPSMRPLMGAGDDPRASADGIFFGDKLDTEASAKRTLLQGSLQLSTFIYQEQGGTFRRTASQIDIDSASPLARYFSELRGQVDAKHVFGGRWDARLDTRIRVAPGDTQITNGGANAVPSSRQSGTFGGNEYELRELYVVRGGDRTDLFVGRQFVLELAGVKFDGLRLNYALGEDLTLVAFGGLYPVRGSRSLDSDYPAGVEADATGMLAASGRVLPFTGGAGAAYRMEKAYGSVGAVAIVPTSTDIDSGATETTRSFVTASGYERFGPSLDVYHFLVLDLTGAAGFGVTNGSLGVNWAPHPRMRVTANVHHVDTETLNVQAQTLLENPDNLGTLPQPIVQNNIEVLRIASDAARLGVSVGLGAQRRFEVSAQGGFRQREEITLRDTANGAVVVPGTKGGEVLFQATDRRSFLGLRVSALVARFFGIGDANYHKSQSLTARLSVSREFARGRGEWEVDAGYLYAQDDTGGACRFNPGEMGDSFQNCYGSSKLSAPSLGGLLSWRFATDWYALASASASLQSLTLKDLAADQTQPAVLGITGFLRVGYRF